MRSKVFGKFFQVWLSAHDTYTWATKPGGAWPCSTLKDKRLFAEFHDGDLVDLEVNGKTGDVPIEEFNAIIEDYCGTSRPGEL